MIVYIMQVDVQVQKKGKGKVGERLEKVVELLMGCFRVCVLDKYEFLLYIGMYIEYIFMQFYIVIYFVFFFSRVFVEDIKKWGMLNFVNQFFKIYFKVSGFGLF